MIYNKEKVIWRVRAMKKRFASIFIGAMMVFGISVSAKTTIEPTILVDQDGILITATELDCEDDSAYGELKLKIENNSDIAVSITSGSIGYNRNAINNYMTNDCYMSVDIEAGKKAVEIIDLGSYRKSYVDHKGIGTITMSFQVDDEDYDELFCSTPIEIKTNKYDEIDYEDECFLRGIQDNEVQDRIGYVIDDIKEGEIFSSDGLVIDRYVTITKTDNEKIVLLEIENTTDSLMFFGVNGLNVNGINVYSGNWVTRAILPHKKAVVDVNLKDMIDYNYANAIGFDDIKQAALSLVSKDEEYNTLNVIETSIFGDDSSYEVNLSGNEVYNANGIQIVAKDVVEQRYDNGDKVFVALVKNDNDFGIILNVPEDISVNDYMIDTTCYSTNIDANSIGIFYFQLDGDSLEDCDITSFDKVEGAIEINDDHWNELDIAEISTSF